AMERAYAVLREGEDNADLAALAQQFGRMLMFQGRVEEGVEPLERALIISQRLALHETLVHALNTKGVLLPNLGRRDEGLALLQRALEVALEQGLHEAA